MKNISIILAILIFTVVLSAQELDDIVTDRPDQTESAVTVPKGTVQVEIGGTYEYDKVTSLKPVAIPSNITKTISAPSVLIRYGLMKNFELRLGGEFINQKNEYTTGTISQLNIADNQGFSPVTVGTKIRLFTELGSRPDAAFIFHVNFPFNKNDEFQPEYICTDFRVAAAHTLSERFSLSYNLGGEWDGNSPGATGIYTLALGVSLANRVGMFVESYGFLPQGSEPDHRLDGGFTYLIARNVQADISGGIGISDISPDFFIGAGISFRLPK